ncbi:CRISPR-associated endoribonuclease Cas6 [Desulfotruncus alcoholivorax]|uniref:CRISPR-associated endoribonuclease Cas6 n=1 Tax=Desulfotruncus alcoholivorax TaxID=265477 RepID=UPI0003FA9E06|nr:CRISPR-associated endoribonuclease Cas6 [Desulfotruncus alcoholivorax]
MHAYIKLRMDLSSPAIPIHYNYLIQSAVYAALPEVMAARIHDEGFKSGKRSFKMFSFSRLLGRFSFDRTAGTIAFPEGVSLVISSPDTGFFLALVNNLLTKSSIRLGQSRFYVEEVRFDEQKAESEVLTVRTLSPVVAYSTLLRPEGGKYTCYYQPGEREFDRLITANLAKKHEAFHGLRPPDGEIKVRPLDRPRLHVTTYKNTVVKGYTCRLKLSGPRELLQMALDAGLGGKGSQGYGCVEKIERLKAGKT